VKPARRGISEDRRKPAQGEIKNKNSVMCIALWWFTVSYISDIEFSEFHA
jgi:hypothetical protein